MGGFLDRLDKMVVTTVSPTRVVKVRINRNDGICVEWGAQGLRGLSAEALSSEITRAVVAALRGTEQGTNQAREASRGTVDAPPRESRISPEKAERRRQVRKGVEALDISATAAQGFVVVDWHGRTDVEVRVAEGALARLTAEALRVSVNEALEDARHKHGKAVAQIFIDAYRFDRFGKKWKERA